MFDLFKREDNNKVSEMNIIIKKIKLDTNYFGKIAEKYKINKNVVSTLLKKEDFRYKYLSEEDRNNKKLYLKIVLNKKDGTILRYAGEDIKTDFNSILISTYFTPYSIDYVKKINFTSKQEIEELLFWIISKDDKLINFIHKDILNKINKTGEELKKLNLDINTIQKKYDIKLGINTKENINNREQKFKLNSLIKTF